ncbi:MAG: hypothetical protein AB7K86_09495 [Rhodospirillales bacterium]
MRRLAAAVLLAGLAVPAAAQQYDPTVEPWRTPVGRTCIDSWAQSALGILNRHVGTDQFNVGKPYTFDGYGNLVSAYSTSAQLPSDWAMFRSDKYWRMWEVYRETDQWRSPILQQANVPLLRNYVRQCVARGGTAFERSDISPQAARPRTDTRCDGIDLTGAWRSDDSGLYCLRQTGNAVAWTGTVRDRGRETPEQFSGTVEGCLATGTAAVGKATGVALSVRITDATSISIAPKDAADRALVPALRRLARVDGDERCAGLK